MDGSDSSMKAVKKAISIAKKFNIPLLSFYVAEEIETPKLLKSEKINQLLYREEEEKAQKILNEVQKFGNEAGIKINTMVIHGTPYEEIINEVHKDDLIIMGRKGHSSFERLFLGSVSERVIHHVDASVMIVK